MINKLLLTVLTILLPGMAWAVNLSCILNPASDTVSVKDLPTVALQCASTALGSCTEFEFIRPAAPNKMTTLTLEQLEGFDSNNPRLEKNKLKNLYPSNIELWEEKISGQVNYKLAVALTSADMQTHYVMLNAENAKAYSQVMSGDQLKSWISRRGGEHWYFKFISKLNIVCQAR